MPLPREASEEPTDPGHPKGTLAVVLVYLLLFVIGWIGLYMLVFLPRGTPDARVDGAADEAPAFQAPADDGGGR